MAGLDSLVHEQINPTSTRRRFFFPILASVLLLIAFVGFSRTFYLRALVDTSGFITAQKLSGQVVIHGVIFSSWILLFLAQSWLATSKKVHLHRKLGIAGTVLAAAVFLSGLLVTLNWLDRLAATNVLPADTTVMAGISGIVLHNFISMLSFAAFVMLAVYWRRNGADHKRLMFFASVSMLGPALSGGDRPIGELLVQFVPRPDAAVILSLIGVLVAYDLLVDRRLRKVTIWGALQ